MSRRRLASRVGRSGALAISVGALMSTFGLPAEARVAQLVVTSVESPTFGGASFGGVGQYERIEGKINGEVDPNDPHDSVIVDIGNAPRNADGMVEYSADVQIIRPVDLASGNHRIIFELPNRGGAQMLSTLNDSPSGNTTATAGNPGNGFLMNEGYTIVEGAWDLTAAQGGPGFGITLPVATHPGGAPITGRATEEFVVDFTAEPTTEPLTYPAATLAHAGAQLTVRENYGDTPIAVPSKAVPGLDWQFIDSTHVGLTLNGSPIAFGAPGTFSPTALYEFTYTAMNPLVAGLGLAAVRDLASFLRDAATDDDGIANPLAGDVQRIYSFCVSQPCRTMRDFVLLGFNEADVPAEPRQHKWSDRTWWNGFWRRQQPAPEKVFDGVLNWIGGGNGEFLNYRFSQPTRTHRQHIARWTPEFQFPFADVATFDPNTRKFAGRLDSCAATKTCPDIFEVNSENEYWAKGGSLLTTDVEGHDLDLGQTPAVRYYQLASLPHGAGTAAGICRQPQNPLRPDTALRALLVDLDDWVTSGKAPPDNQVPQVRSGTLVPSLPQSRMGFPNIPGIVYDGIMHTGDLWDFGRSFEEGVLTVLPPHLVGTPYKVLVPKTDADGNDIAGIRLPDVSVPLATYTGYALRAPHAGQPVPIVDGCDASGQRIPFAPTKASRQPGGANAGDPRLSVEERFPGGSAQYVAAVTAAANALKAQRLLLQQDVEAYVAAAQAVVIP